MNIEKIKDTLVKVLNVSPKNIIFTETPIANEIVVETTNMVVIASVNKPEVEAISDGFIVARTTKGGVEPMWLADNHNASHICNSIIDYYKDVMQLLK